MGIRGFFKNDGEEQEAFAQKLGLLIGGASC